MSQFSDNLNVGSTSSLNNLPAPVAFVQSLQHQVNEHDIQAIIQSQKHMLVRFEKTNEMLVNCNALLASRYTGASKELKKHISFLTDLKKDLDSVFRRIRFLKMKVSQQYPESFAAITSNLKQSAKLVLNQKNKMVFTQVLKKARHPKLMSQILRFREPVPKEKGSNASTSKSMKLMLNEGFIKPVSPGMLSLMPLALRPLEKLIYLIDAFMTNVNGQKVLFPSLIQQPLMKVSGRWDNNSNLFKLKDRSQNSYCLGATHEEIATSLLSNLLISYKILPLRLYQISSKFRDEMNPKLGLLRGREFIMKDMYTYDANEKDAEKTYMEICDAYEKLFSSLGIEFVKVIGSSGDIGGHSSHEFHILSNVGEDEILFCPKCKMGYNIEVFCNKNLKCSTCNLEFERKNAIEIGHAFLLGTTYSKPFHANYNSPHGSHELLQMGCYGLGLSRILAASIESLSTADNIRWPLPLAPFQLSVIVPKKGSKEEPVTPFAIHLADCLNKIDWLNSNIVIDERTHLTIGKRLQDAAAVGIPFAIVVADSALEDVPKVEVVDVYNSQTMFLTHKEVLNHFRSKSLLHFSVLKSAENCQS